MKPERYIYMSDGPASTAALAEAIAGLAGPGTVIGLDGDLGAGKTAFSQAFARAIGVAETVNSPTFTLIKEYEDGRMPLYHMDVYRISPAEADELGLDDYFFGEGVTLVEWADRIDELLPDNVLQIRIGHAGEERRIIRLEPKGEPYETWCAILERNGVLTS